MQCSKKEVQYDFYVREGKGKEGMINEENIDNDDGRLGKQSKINQSKTRS